MLLYVLNNIMLVVYICVFSGIAILDIRSSNDAAI